MVTLRERTGPIVIHPTVGSAYHRDWQPYESVQSTAHPTSTTT
ncbi:hypothetical protein BJP36_37365 [Moorena producens JHB]|uniref:Uncharacterized protein n=1 Tax=Moorena producens (strain JHB) TaxID=1454205 RepID=A0A9Q9SUA4_MOOP1|nr:hypothetical protein [Moorena producens]WAN69765.1 hypothetical protein BJP36_37365 [Moorena producens JHB]